MFVFQGDIRGMLQQKLFSFVCVFSLLVPFSSMADMGQYEIAQGDGDPTEISVQEQLDAAKKIADEEDVATITAEGDFLVPTYLLKTVDDKDEKSPEEDEFVVENKKPVQPDVQKTEKIIAVHDKTEYDLPVVKIKQTELIPVAEQMAVEKKLTGSTKQTKEIYDRLKGNNKEAKVSEKQASQTTKANPTEKDILKNIKVSSSVTNIQKETPKAEPKPVENKITISADDEINSILSGSFDTEEKDTGKKKPLLLPLKGIKKATKTTVADEQIPAPTRKTYASIFADKVLEAAQTNQNLPLIMPMDLKISFYPNSADFSGQTIKWVKAFSYRALQDPRYVIEIRLSKSNPHLQQKRLLLVQKILKNAGLSSHQLVVDYVKRPADSLILRMVKKEPHTNITGTDKKTKKIINW